MSFICAICSDVVTVAENLYVTHCGHIFHHHCLAQWIERSKSCPQCRNKVTQKSMYRLYPTVSNETNIDDAATLQTRLDDLQLQMQQKIIDCNTKEKEVATLSDDLLKKVETLASYKLELVSKASVVSMLKERLKSATYELTQLHKINSENEALKKNIETLNGLQQVFNATSAEVDTMLKNHSDIKTVATFASALKRALTDSEAKKVEYRNKFYTLKQQNAIDKMSIAQLKARLATSQEQVAVLERFTRKRKSSISANQSKDETADKRPKNSDPVDLNAAVIVIDDDADDTLPPPKEQSEAPRPNMNECDVGLTAQNLQSVPTAQSKDTPPPPKEQSEAPQPKMKECSVALSEQNLHSKPTAQPKEKSVKEHSESPYLKLRQCSVALTVANIHSIPTARLKPSEQVIVNAANRTLRNCSQSIFRKKEPLQADPNRPSTSHVSYDGLGGHSTLDVFPKPKPNSKVPVLTAKHRLRRPASCHTITDHLNKSKEAKPK